MKKTLKYKNPNPTIPYNFVSLSSGHNTTQWKAEADTDNYFFGELSYNKYCNQNEFYHNLFKTLTKSRKNKKREIITYEWKEFLLFLFSTFQKISKIKLVPRARAEIIRGFLEDFQHNVINLNQLDKKFSLQSKADKIFYLKKEDKEYLIGFMINKKLFITFSYILNRLVDKYVNHYSGQSVGGNRTYNNNFRDLLYYSIYKKWGIEIETKKLKGKITIGADPEFLIYPKFENNPKIADYRKLISASNVILTDNGNDELGIDGCSTLGELRPKPSTSPYMLTRRIKGLFNKFYSDHGGDYFIESGGGCGISIGGHIHFGHSIFKNFTQAQIKPLLQLLDAFLYYPIKLNMYGAVREWKDFNELDVEIDYYNGECKVDENPEKIIQVIKKIKPLKGQQFTNFDLKSQCRSQPHGLEYRSLPSFVGDFTFTKLVLSLAKGIAEKYIELKTQGIEFTYNDPPQKEDYRVFLREKEVNQLWEYLYGKKKDLFLKNTLDNWKVVKQFFINIQDSLDMFNWSGDNASGHKIEEKLTKGYRPELLEIGNSLKVYLLASNHYFQSSRWGSLSLPTFIVTRNVNFSTLTGDEISSFLRVPEQNNIYIGFPYIWRDRGYINKKNISRIISQSLTVFKYYYKKKNTFKFDQTPRDLKKIPLYNSLLLSQIAEEVNQCSKVFLKGKKKEKPKISESTQRAIERERIERNWATVSDPGIVTEDNEVRLARTRVWSGVSGINSPPEEEL